jgi:hypothetical protein
VVEAWPPRQLAGLTTEPFQEHDLVMDLYHLIDGILFIIASAAPEGDDPGCSAWAIHLQHLRIPDMRDLELLHLPTSA